MIAGSYRLALDLGTNSLGWCMLDLNDDGLPTGVRTMGVRIFPDGRDAKSKASLAVDRRLARQMRRMHDRYIQRRSQLMQALVAHGLMPSSVAAQKELERLDPYVLRATGMHAPLALHELGRALFHLNQRRGFKSNRKTDGDADSGKVKPAIQRLRQLIGSKTLGEYLHGRRCAGLTVRSRLIGKGAKAAYEFYPDRSLVEEEFDRLWEAQARFHPELTDTIREELRDTIFFQRKLKPVNPGRCTLEPDKQRAPSFLPVAQRFRIYQELNQLRMISPELRERPLTLTERDFLAAHLLTGKDLAFTTMRTKLGLPPGSSFNLEGENRDKLKGDATAALLSKKNLFGKAWFGYPWEEQERIVDLLLEAEDESELTAILVNDWGIPPDNASALANMAPPAGYSRLCREALRNVTQALEAEVIPYADAVLKAGYTSHSNFHTGEIHDRLPYYGIPLQRYTSFGSGDNRESNERRYGRIANPSVHITLNQVRRVVNEILKEHGHPAQVVLEVGRDLKHGLMARREIMKRQKEQQQSNDRRRSELQSHGIAVTGDSLLRLRLWEELHRDPAARCCPYTGEHISLTRLFSQEVEVEHILPFARTLDNSPANKTVGLRRANRLKGNRSPFEAFGSSPDGYFWEDIVSRGANMPANKRWRFASDAMQHYEDKRDFLDRQLTDTQYISRVARQYLCCICDPKQVWVTPGRLTSLLAARWGFPPKDRIDHRHHARDAALIGVMDRSLLQRVATHHAREQEQGLHRFLADLQPPWPDFRVDVLNAIAAVVVSHKTDHGVRGRLHNDTAYGILAPNGVPGNAQHRVGIETINKVPDILKIKGLTLGASLLAEVTGLDHTACRHRILELRDLPAKRAETEIKKLVSVDDKEFTERIASFASKRGIRRVRLRETITLIPINDREGREYKGFKGDSNAYYAIYMQQDGAWIGEIVSTMDANRPGFQPVMEATGHALITRLFINDMLEIEHQGRLIIAYVTRISEKQIALAEHFEANVDKRNRDNLDAFSFIYKCSPSALANCGARPVFVTPAGKVIYPEMPRHATPCSGNSG